MSVITLLNRNGEEKKIRHCLHCCWLFVNAITSIMPRHPHTPYAPQHKSRRRIGIALTCGDSQQHRRAAAIFYYLKLFQIISPIFQFIQLILHVSTAPTAFGTCLAVCLSWQIYWVSVNWIVKFVNPVSCALLRLIHLVDIFH